MVVKRMQSNTEAAKRVVMQLASSFKQQRIACPYGSHKALDGAIMTARSARDPELMKKLDAVAGRLLRQKQQ